MFTGLIQDVGSIVKVTGSAKPQFIVRAPKTAAQLRIGDSVSVSGICLTAVNVSHTSFTADLATETLRRTSLSRLMHGAQVNLELPLKFGAPLGGHLVQGHVDGTGSVQRLSAVRGGNDWTLEVKLPQTLMRFIVAKGSIAIEGISLTVATVRDTRIFIAIIPQTYKATNLSSLNLGDPVNIEVDIFAKQADVARASLTTKGIVSLQKLIGEGF